MPAASRFIQDKIGIDGAGTHLYGSCYRALRYKDDAAAQWRDEMIEIADAIGYTGKVSGFDTSSKGAKIKADETTYVEYRVNGDSQCTIYFKRMSKMDVVTTFGGTDADVSLIRRDMGKTKDVWNPAFKLTDTTTSNLTSSAAIKPTKSNKGELHLVKTGAIDSFEHGG